MNLITCQRVFTAIFIFNTVFIRNTNREKQEISFQNTEPAIFVRRCPGTTQRDNARFSRGLLSDAVSELVYGNRNSSGKAPIVSNNPGHKITIHIIRK